LIKNAIEKAKEKQEAM